MKKNWVLTQESFDDLLCWLDPNRELAARRYEEIRQKLITLFTCRGCHEAEDMADETINRVAAKLPEIRSGYEGDTALYFYGVARKVQLEFARRRPVPMLPVSNEDEALYECLEKCLHQLTAHSREMILQYYQEEKRAKVDQRRWQAQRLGIPINALRIRVHRLRAVLQQCVEKCQSAEAKTEMVRSEPSLRMNIWLKKGSQAADE